MPSSGLRDIAGGLAAIAQTLAEPQATKLEALERALGLLRRVVPHDRCALLEAGTSGGFYAPRDLPSAERPALSARMRQLLAALEDSEDAPHAATPAPAGRAHVALPVLGLNQTMGLLFVERDVAPFDEDALRLLTVTTAQLGAYLGTLRLREQEVERAQELGVVLQRLKEVDRRKDDFLALLAHELRNPLGAINNALFLLGRQDKSDELSVRYHRIMDRQLSHLSRLVDDLLDASRVRLGKIVLRRRVVDLRGIAQRWLDAYGAGPAARAHDLQVELDAQPVTVDGDEVRLEQIFANLLTNALKYTPRGGEIFVSLGVESGQAVLRVRDSGIGISADMLPRVFDIFAQADESLAHSQGGLGLGLSLVRSLVQMHGGTVEAFSRGANEGSEFVVRIPSVTFSGIAEESIPSRDEVVSSAPLRVLVVEDNEDARLTLTLMLEGWHHKAIGASDGVEGLARCIADAPDVALIDIGLPGVDGFELARRLRQHSPQGKLHLVAMTGYGEPEKRRRATESGFDTYLVKPFDPGELQRLLAVIAGGFKPAPPA